ncbi:MAG: substrate-binding domain-containing protein [Lentisphaeria bacterium]|nr:substrate-binding domain-containing protein [Lentisphaeria bacterium]
MKNVLVAFEFYRSPLFEGIAKYAQDHNWHLSLDMLNKPSDIPWGWDGDGIITMVIQNDSPLIHFLEDCNKPTVNLEGRHFSPQFLSVLSDTKIAANMAFDYFRTKGFKNFAFYGKRHSTRGFAFVDECKRNGFNCPILTEWEGTWKGAMNMTKDWLKAQKKPLAVYCWTDYAGAKLIDMAHSLGYKIPEEIAVLGMDNEELICNSTAIRLSSIKTELQSVGYEGAKMLDQLMNNPELELETKYISPSEVVTRASTDTLTIKSKSVEQAITYMQENYHNFINITDVVNNSQITRRGLEKAFLSTFKMTPRDMLENLRIEQAKKKLIATKDKIYTISKAVGINDPRYFSTIFRRHTGRNPRDYRK